jgi:hypothetical protein
LQQKIYFAAAANHILFIYLFHVFYILIAAAEGHQIYLYVKFYNGDADYVPWSWHHVTAYVAKTFILQCSLN